MLLLHVRSRPCDLKSLTFSHTSGLEPSRIEFHVNKNYGSHYTLMDAVYQVPIAPGIAHGKHMLTVASVALTGDYQIYSSVKESTF